MNYPICTLLALSSFVCHESYCNDKYLYLHQPNQRTITYSFANQDCIGTFDGNGHFDPDTSQLEMIVHNSKSKGRRLFNTSRPNMVYMPQGVGDVIYQFRYGRLIPFQAVANDRGGLGFQPQINSPIINIRDYVYSEKARRIENLPGTYVSSRNKSVPEGADYYIRSLQANEDRDLSASPQYSIYCLPLVANASCQNNWGQLFFEIIRTTTCLPDRFEFKPIEAYRCSSIAAGERCNGTIDSYGTFIPDISEIERIVKIRKHQPIQNEPVLLSFILAPCYRNEKVYEYCKGCLIPMIFDNKNQLIPEVGGKIIDFKDYKYSPTARRIYNLPGRFVLKSQQGEKKP